MNGRLNPPLQVEWTGPALDDVRRLDRRTRERISRTVERYAATGHGDVRYVKSVGLPALRVGDWRVYFEERETVLRVLYVRHRKNAYRR